MSLYNKKVGGGLSFFGVVLIFGIILALLGVSIGVGATIRIPATDFSLSLGGSLGKKEVVKQVLPQYLTSRVGDDNTFINQSITATVWVAEGISVVVIGYQPEAPTIDLSLNLQK